MKKITNNRISFLLLGFSALATYSVIVFYHFPYFGFSLLFFLLATIIYYFKPVKTTFNRLLYLLILALSLFITLRANEQLVFLNILVIVLLGGALIHSAKHAEVNFGFVHFLTAPFVIFLRSLLIKSEYNLNLVPIIKNKIKLGKEKTSETVISISITVILLFIILPLLSSANPIFNKALNEIAGFLNLQNIFNWFFSDRVFIWIFRLVVFLILAFFIPKLFTYNLKNDEEKLNFPWDYVKINYGIPKVVTSIILFLFFLTQLQLYFSTADSLLALGITHSEYAREVFTQLSVVALIILGLIYNDKSKTTLAKLLTFLLVLEGLFLTFIALKSVYDYSYNWGFTHKRLWGFTMVFWLQGLFALFIYKYSKFLQNVVFVKSVIIFSAIVMIGVNFLNFDYLIYRYKKSITHSGVDYYYMSFLSADSQSYMDLYLELKDKTAGMEIDNPEFNKYAFRVWRVLNKIEYLQKKYEKFDLRTFNLSEYRQFQQVKDLDIEKLKIRLIQEIPSIVNFKPV